MTGMETPAAIAVITVAVLTAAIACTANAIRKAIRK